MISQCDTPFTPSDAFPDDDLVWRSDWIGGVGYNAELRATRY
jgi:hypothetical protein